MVPSIVALLGPGAAGAGAPAPAPPAHSFPSYLPLELRHWLSQWSDRPTSPSSHQGLLPRLVAALFVTIATDTAHAFEVKAAMFQIYNEQIDDLLVDDRSSQGNNLNIKQGGLVDGLSWIGVRNPDECMKLFSKGRANIIYAETKMNKASSRSHSVFQFKVGQGDLYDKRGLREAGALRCPYLAAPGELGCDVFRRVGC